jgi:zinc transporter 1
MALSKSRRMQILLAIDVVFFFIELVVGISVHSLALVADSFHMLNDVISLCVGLWAVHVAKSRPRSKTFTYGWQGAETLGALINGVFLIALCFSIILEAIQRFFDPPEIGDPRWIFGVGCAGLVTNILGLFLFHDHSHSHGHSDGEDEHAHKPYDEVRASEEGISTAAIADETGRIEDVLPENRVRVGVQHSQAPIDVDAPHRSQSLPYQRSSLSSSLPHIQHIRSSGSRRRKSRTLSTVDDIATHPAYMRSDIIAASKGSRTVLEEQDEYITSEPDNIEETDHTPLLNSKPSTPVPTNSHSNHKHSNAQSSDDGGKSHSHNDLNMRGVWLHVLGDALGNVGVIATALFIQFTTFSWRFYADPFISLVIACIILYSAYPLCRAASRILLMAVPIGVNIDDIKADVLALSGVAGVHHVHVWQLSDTTLVASLHVRVDDKVVMGGEGGDQYMRLAKGVRRCLHAYGIHSTTIQPEFCTTKVKARHTAAGETGIEDDSCREEDTASESRGPANGVTNESSGCLLDCEDDCGPAGKCCGPQPDGAK